jgi:hypothetical protein
VESFDLKMSTPKQLQQQQQTTISTNMNEYYHKTKLLQPNFKFKNILYIYPKYLKYDAQKTFAKVSQIHHSVLNFEVVLGFA